MKFYGNGIVWDKENGKPLCKFEEGEYETTEKREQEILKELGYKSDSKAKKSDK